MGKRKTNEGKRLAELYRQLRALHASLRRQQGWKATKTLFTAAEAQKALGISRGELRAMYRTGCILAARAHGDEGRWLFAKSEIDRLRPGVGLKPAKVLGRVSVAATDLDRLRLK